jgi:hypothetical protein
MLKYTEPEQVLIQKHKMSLECPIHHIKFNRGMGCSECNKTKTHGRSFIPSNVIWHNPTES